MTYRAEPFVEPTSPTGKVAELFAGVGGFRIGLSRANLATVFSNQWEPSTKVQHASDVYVARFGSRGHTNIDISQIDYVQDDFDMLVGGFPCQDYSVAKAANSATGLEGKKGVLWWEILRLVINHKPKFIFLENVDRLLASPKKQTGRDFAVMLTTLGNAGYMVEWRVVNAAEYGLPQRRKRVFIVATREDLIPRNEASSDALFAGGVLAEAFPFSSNATPLPSFDIDRDPTEVSNSFVRPGNKPPFGNAGLYKEGRVTPWHVHSRWEGNMFSLGDVLIDDADVPAEYWVSPERISEWEYLKGAKSLDRVHRESGFAYKYSEGAMSFPDSLEKPSRTILTGEGGVTPSRFKHIIARPQGLRRLVPVELERLCGFPDDWTNPVLDRSLTDARRAFFMGNALVVGLVEMVGNEIVNRLNSSDSSHGGDK